jgi:hypothetical protein
VHLARGVFESHKTHDSVTAETPEIAPTVEP